MSTSDIDTALVHWGAHLFNRRQIAPTATKKSITTGLVPKAKPKKKAGAGQATMSATEIRSRLGSLTKRTPEVMVKVTGGAKGMGQVRAHLEYISRNGKIELENQDGETFTGREGLADIRDEWQLAGFIIPEEGTRREAFNVVFSMPEGTDPAGVKRAVRDFAAVEFENHEYVMALHTFDTDPDKHPARHPHVHLVVKAAGRDGVRLNPRKEDLQRWREGFAEALRAHGIEATATRRQPRLHREYTEKKVVREKRERGETLDRVGQSAEAWEVKRKSLDPRYARQGPATPERIAKAKRTERETLKNFKGVTDALVASDDPRDHQLARDVGTWLQKTYVRDAQRPHRDVERERGQGRDTER